MNVLNEWAYVGVFFLIAPLLPSLPIVIGGILAPRKPNAIKQATYECGLETVGDTWVQFKVQYYIYGLIFLVFDVEMVFLFPWAVTYDRLGLLGFVEMAIFLAILVGGYGWVWRRGQPVRQHARHSERRHVGLGPSSGRRRGG